MSPADPERPAIEDSSRSTDLWCGVCGKILARAAEEVARLAREGWPRCCGQVMSYFSPADSAAPPREPKPAG